MSKLVRGFWIGLTLALIILVAAAAYGLVTVRKSFPKIEGEIQVQGLDGPVDIYRDEYGIPHIYAANQHDLFFAQGYVHAQDRFWQMDFWRHISSGRLSEMFGEGSLETDGYLRTLGFARIAQQEWESMDESSRAILQSYTDGVNAYLAGRQESGLSLEYSVLGLLNAEYQVEPWKPVESLAWGKMMAYDLGGNMDVEIERALLLKDLTPDQLASLEPLYPEEHPVIVPGQAAGAAQRSLEAYSSALPGEVWADLESLSRAEASLQALAGPTGPDIGSNSWVISGERTASGMPLLANDPHLGVQMPSIWYENGLHCIERGPECPFQVTGFSFAGVPGVVIGHNNRIAWGFTNLGPDVQDLYIEKLNPENPNQYEYQGEWLDMQVITETLRAPGGVEIPFTVRYTLHGPVMPGETETLGAAGIELPENYAVSLRWTALEPAAIFKAVWGFNQAQNWEEFRAAAANFDVPSQNLVYADVDGNIGYQMPGKVPVRQQGDGLLPAPGWTGEYEWSGYIPFEELPSAYNPPEGYIVTANNAVVSPDYPYFITADWDRGYRAKRIVDMLEGAVGPVTVETMQEIQGDNFNPLAGRLVPLLLALQFEEDNLLQAQSVLEAWDHQGHMDSGGAALFEVTWRHLLARTFHDDLPEDFLPSGGDRWVLVMLGLLDDPDNPWWDFKPTEGPGETRDEILRLAFESAVRELEQEQGRDPQDWNWGDLHTITFENGSLGGPDSPGPIRSLFNRGPFRVSGGNEQVNATHWVASSDGYQVEAIPSMRMIVDLGDLSGSLAVNSTGESGHAFHPHYYDMVDLWRTIRYHPMQWERSQVEEGAKAHLRLAGMEP
jgi:penicillin amidase